MAGKRRHRTKVDLQIEQALRQARTGGSRIVTAWARSLQSPRPEADLVGEQTHFLRRIERLPGDAQGLAIRLYYSYELRRFVARKALGVKPAKIGHEELPDDLGERRVVVSIEPGSTPARLIFDGRGKVITCLAPDMAVGSGTRVSYQRFTELVARFKDWQELQVNARDLAASTDLVQLCLGIRAGGWLTPRETLETLAGLGPAGGPLVMLFLPDALNTVAEDFGRAVAAGPRDDRRLRDYFRSAARLAAYFTLLAEWGVEPKLDLIVKYLEIGDLVTSTVLGACLAVWRPFGGLALIAEGVDELSKKTLPYRYASMACLGMSRRLLRRNERATEIISSIDDCFGAVRDAFERYEREQAVLGLEPDPLFRLQRDMAVLAQGGRPDWGDDLADDPDTLPPLRLDDLCLPGDTASPRALRILVQRLFASVGRPLWHLFLPAAELARWRERLGPLDEVRQGDFYPPGIERDAPLPGRASLPGRNEPCLCGSGKKFKRCCLPKIEAGESVG